MCGLARFDLVLSFSQDIEFEGWCGVCLITFFRKKIDLIKEPYVLYYVITVQENKYLHII